jgi:hypothetical protein
VIARGTKLVIEAMRSRNIIATRIRRNRWVKESPRAARNLLLNLRRLRLTEIAITKGKEKTRGRSGEKINTKKEGNITKRRSLRSLWRMLDSF